VLDEGIAVEEKRQWKADFGGRPGCEPLRSTGQEVRVSGVDQLMEQAVNMRKLAVAQACPLIVGALDAAADQLLEDLGG
jgi:hypothetical protein